MKPRPMPAPKPPQIWPPLDRSQYLSSTFAVPVAALLDPEFEGWAIRRPPWNTRMAEDDWTNLQENLDTIEYGPPVP